MTEPVRWRLTPEFVVRCATLALEGIDREHPYHPMHVIMAPDDLRTPRRMHPAFFGCFDWHSAVHGHWLLVRVLRRFPHLALADQVRAALNAHLRDENLRAEAGYFAEAGRAGFERTYGWAWLLKLREETLSWDDDDARRWAVALEPLAAVIVRRYHDFLPRQHYPIRTGVHPNTAFGLAFALDYALATGDDVLAGLIRRRSLDYYAADQSVPAGWEPNGNDFFSPSLMEADLMRRVLPPLEFAAWLDRFLPNLRAGKPETLLNPAIVTDRTDGQLVHIDGLNLSRAWCFWNVAQALPEQDARRGVLAGAAERHADAGLQGIGSGDYMGDHWLGTFALYMLEAAEAFGKRPA